MTKLFAKIGPAADAAKLAGTTEAITLVSEIHVPDSLYEEVREFFNEKEIVDLTFVVTTINAWNRLAVSCKSLTKEADVKQKGPVTGKAFTRCSTSLPRAKTPFVEKWNLYADCTDFGL